ncbi:MAG TPA: metalloregulator ArsR/SmtB family transcription factor [Oligoflexus sp.]|uniref:ArsR/SmtB family transcription factor n=1 Tax=Oligoflexus sp. TaxID=1971216 RepID=UPI002D7F4350|nr:metalloregulator ArsR/SmtB family transcription factor [Oligoflexus sp.]HET9237036.1 metalloregulator ArsR/SmtB family transcription factor [Oligoflexus sp.]
MHAQKNLDLVFRALSDPSRRAIVERVSEGPVSVSELAEPLKISVPAVLQHLQLLEECGLVATRKIGRTRSCQIVPEGLSVLEQWTAARRSMWEKRFDRLGGILEEP